MPHCCVVYCSNDSRYLSNFIAETGKSLHLHTFPNDAILKKQWIIAIKRDEGPNFKVNVYVVVCVNKEGGALIFYVIEFNTISFNTKVQYF